MLNFGNHRVTHIYKGTELVDSVRYGKETIFPYNADDLIKYCRLYTDLGYSPKYIRMLQKAGLDLDNLDNEAIEYAVSMLGLNKIDLYTKYYSLKNYPQVSGNDMSNMFGNKSSLISVDLSNCDTRNATHTTNMFNKCESLIAVDLSTFDMSNVWNMFNMFGCCSSLVYVDLSSIKDVSRITKYGLFFYGCTSLKYIRCTQDVKDWCISNVDTIMLTTFDTVIYEIAD